MLALGGLINRKQLSPNGRFGENRELLGVWPIGRIAHVIWPIGRIAPCDLANRKQLAHRDLTNRRKLAPLGLANRKRLAPQDVSKRKKLLYLHRVLNCSAVQYIII
jgi:hypothetical protein